MHSGIAWIGHHAQRAPGSLAIAGPDQELTYEQLYALATRAASTLKADGVQRGDRVLLVAPSVPEFAVYYFALQALGAVAVTSNTMSTRPELEYVINDAGCSLALAWHKNSEALREAAHSCGIPFIVIEPGEPAGTGSVEPVDVAIDDTAVILYTSGTTGQPKGAQLTFRCLDSAAAAFNQVLRLSPEERFATALPLFHVFGQAAVMATAFRGGASLTLMPKFDPEALMRLVRDRQITMLAGVPTMWNAMLHSAAAFGPEDFASLRLATSGGASLPAEVIKQFSERFGCVILEGYGLSETTGAATFNGIGRERKAGYVGIPLPGCEIAVRDADGADLPAGTPGEVCIKGPVVMKGYWNRPEATDAVMHDGWFSTGDVGILDEDGDLRLVDRTKDMIIRGGYNVYPREVEEVLYEHPDIIEVAVIGVPHDRLGEEVAAAVALRPGADFDPEGLRAWAKERLSAYKVPHLFTVVDELPKGPTGKILKRAIDRAALNTEH